MRNKINTTNINIPNYEKHWLESTKTGWQIRIATSTDQLYIIDCHFKTKQRDRSGRITERKYANTKTQSTV